MNKHKIVTVILAVLTVVLVLGYFVLFEKEVDDIAENGPIKSKFISKTDQIPVFQNMLAAGISWDYDKDRFFISTDQPHGLFTEEVASFYVVNSALDQILYSKNFNTDGDLEGIAYIGNNEVAIISEIGTIYYMKENNNEWELKRKVSVFNGNGKHKLSSLAYDPANERLFSAEKEGEKIIYEIGRDGILLNSFNFEVGDIAAKREFDINRDYTISGMAYANQHLYIFSEAYSTIFKYKFEAKQLTDVYGIRDIHESAGMTLKKDVVYLVGDFEDYLPAPNFYTIDIPD